MQAPARRLSSFILSLATFCTDLRHFPFLTLDISTLQDKLTFYTRREASPNAVSLFCLSFVALQIVWLASCASPGPFAIPKRQSIVSESLARSRVLPLALIAFHCDQNPP